MRLTDTPILQNQPCATSCVPTSIAMATGQPVAEVIGYMQDALGFDVSKGLLSRQEYLYLTLMGIGYETFMARAGVGVMDGHYLAQVASLNKTRYTHCVFVHIKDCEATVFDPNNGKEGLAYYAYDGFNACPVLTFTKLDDFKDLL